MSKVDPGLQAKIDQAMITLRVLMTNAGQSYDAALANPAIADELRPYVAREWAKEQSSVRISDPLVVATPHKEWLRDATDINWYYWNRLRAYLLEKKKWPEPTIRSIDRVTDRVLGLMENPRGEQERFDTRGLVVGYVQSGKTANYTSLIAKAVDAGYRLVIVLTGIHESLRVQTQRRLDAELVGVVNGKPGGVGKPTAAGRQWITFTEAVDKGDFNPGTLNSAAISMERPSLMVIKKNATVLLKLINWLREAPDDIRKRVPALIIDDEADQASINTGGNRSVEDVDPTEEPVEEESPTKINLRIRELLRVFERSSYVAYTATPFANVLIEHTAQDREGGFDLYPRSFIVSLPKPHGYYGAERIFGTEDGSKPGMDIVRLVPEAEISALVPARRAEIAEFQPQMTPSLRQAFDDFVLAGAARMQRGHGNQPATMLIHTSYSNTVQHRLYREVQSYMDRFIDDWHYSKQRKREMVSHLSTRWETDFRTVTRSENADLDVPFETIEPHIGPFVKRLQTLQINIISEDQLDYERDADLKVIVVGGNRLSRGLTLEGLLVSFFVRATKTYDTLMQMGRWFGYRDGYADLTRIWTTDVLHSWFRDLATIEDELRDEIARYERENLTPIDLGVKIRQHPSMLVTSPLKMQGRIDKLKVSYAGQTAQTINFPLKDLKWLNGNLDATRALLATLGKPSHSAASRRPVWEGVPAHSVLDFLERYQMDSDATRVKAEPIRKYIQAQLAYGELDTWVVGVMGNKRPDKVLGELSINVPGCPSVNLIERTRLAGDQTSLGVIISPADEELGLSDDQLEEARRIQRESSEKISWGRALRMVRSPHQGLMLIYPISRHSGHKLGKNAKKDAKRVPIYADPEQGTDIIALSLVFPDSKTAATVEYIIGSVGPGESL